jgi:uncharacterized membrane protein YphA (DoxX/SURF4 family)
MLRAALAITGAYIALDRLLPLAGAVAGDHLIVLAVSGIAWATASACLALGLQTSRVGAGVATIEVISILLTIAAPGFAAKTFMPHLFTAAVALAIALTGPGAYSVDARLFGRREIVLAPPLDQRPGR